MWFLVTGGAKNLGEEICYHLAKSGFFPVVHYKTSQAEAERVAEKCRSWGVQAETIHGDFSSLPSIQHFVQEYLSRFPQTSAIIHNVGAYSTAGILDISSEVWLELANSNLNAPWFISKELLPSLKATKGSIIHLGVTGLNGLKAPNHAQAYMIVKHALLMLTKTLAKETCKDGVRVNMISPGHMENSLDLDQFQDKLPLGRPATFQEIVRVILFLLDPKSAYITGQNIEVAGGFAL